MARTKQAARKGADKKRAAQGKKNNTRAASKSKAQDRKKRRYRPGVVALREIRKYQRSCELLIPKLPFQRLVKEILGCDSQFRGQDFRWTRDALKYLSDAAEAYLVQLLEDANVCAIHSKRVTLMARDMHLAVRLQNQPCAVPRPMPPAADSSNIKQAETQQEEGRQLQQQKQHRGRSRGS